MCDSGHFCRERRQPEIAPVMQQAKAGRNMMVIALCALSATLRMTPVCSCVIVYPRSLDASMFPNTTSASVPETVPSLADS